MGICLQSMFSLLNKKIHRIHELCFEPCFICEVFITCFVCDITITYLLIVKSTTGIILKPQKYKKTNLKILKGVKTLYIRFISSTILKTTPIFKTEKSLYFCIGQNR